MHEFTFFLLKNWLPVGIASIVFFLVGLLIAKFIWGRYAQRLSFAVEENLNLASQWSALGSSQRDLFKKLRSRWQDDRNAWEARLAETEEGLLARDARIAQLINQLQSDGKSVPAELEIDMELRQEVAKLRAELETREARIEELEAEVELRGEETLAVGLPMALGGALENTATIPAESGGGELTVRIRDLEQDLIDTHDELHSVRTEYQKQVELVETLEARLIEQEEKGARLGGTRIEELESRLQAGEAQARKAAQLVALATQRSREIASFRAALSAVRSENGRLNADLEEALNTKQFEQQVKFLQALLGEREIELREARERIDTADREITELRESLAEREASIVTMEERLAEAEVMDRRRILLQAELNDACHEMYDVRSALRNRLDEIEILEARLDELDEVEEQKGALEMTLHDTRHELSDLRIAYNEKVAELEQRRAEMEELEAIIEDRGAEVNDLSDELRQKRDQLRVLKETLAEKEGELEALSFESDSFTRKLAAKETYLSDQSRRIADLEEALASRYTELNEVRSRYDEEAKAAKYHSARAEQVESELERRQAEFDAADRKIATAEQALDEASLRIEDLSNRLNVSEAAMAELQEQLRIVSREKDDTLRELERANRRIEELEGATSEREQRIIQFETDWKEAVGQSEALEKQLGVLQEELKASEDQGGLLRSENEDLHRRINASTDRGEQLSRRIVELERQIEQLQVEVEEANVHRDAARGSIENLEARLRSSDERVLALSRQLEEQDRELTEWKGQVERLQGELDQKADLARAREEAERVRERLDTKLNAAIRDQGLLRAAAEGRESAQNEDIQKLRKELDEKERAAASLAEQREKSLAEIDRLRVKVTRRGESIRDLQNEVSSIMMQRADRDNEISMLKNKLRAVESELESARKATKVASQAALSDGSAIKDLEQALQNTLSAELSQGGGTSLDELPEESGGSHHSLAAETSAEKAPIPAEKTAPDGASARTGNGDEEPRVLFEEGSAELSSDAKRQIDDLAQTIRRGGRNISVSVIGFAGAEGTPDYSESLSARRAEAVRERLLARGVPQSVLSVRGSGQDRRFSDERARRVELVLQSKALAEAVN